MLKDSQVDLCGRTDFTRTAPLLARDEAFSFACAGCGGSRSPRPSRSGNNQNGALCGFTGRYFFCGTIASGRDMIE